MADSDLTEPITRRRVLALGGGVAGGLVSAGALGANPATALAKRRGHRPGRHGKPGKLPAARMQAILEAEGNVSHGVLGVSIDRTDISNVTLRGVAIKPSFEVAGDLTFQPVGRHHAFFNGDIPLKPDEVNPVIDAIMAHGLVFQAEHQHFYDFDPPVWFIHFRGQGHPITLAKAVHKVLKATSTPLPQQPPSKPTTPFDQDRLQSILHGYDAEVAEDGVVTVFVARRDRIHIDGVRVKPEANVATNVAFQPLNAGGSQAAVAPDFGMRATEVNHVVRAMRKQGWDIGCLYNQETDERPQLFFSHQFKTGDPYELAQEVRRGLRHMNTR